MQIGNEVLTSHPKKRSHRFFVMSTRDIVWTGFSALLMTVAIATASSSIRTYILILGVVTWILSMFKLPKNDERVYWQPVLLVSNWLLRSFRAYGLIWDNSQPSKRLRRAVNPIIPLKVVGFGDIGLIYNRHRDTFSIVFTALGSEISSMNIAAQKAKQDELAEAVRKMAASVKEPVQVSFGVRARPEDPYALFNEIALRGEPEVVLPRALEKDPSTYTDEDRRMLFLHSVQRELPSILEMANDVDMFMVVSVRSTDAFKRALKKRSIKDKELNKQPIMRLKSLALPHLEKVTGEQVTVLDAEGVERFLRKAWDVTGLREYYERAHRRRVAGEEIIPDKWYPQQHIKVGPSHVEIDSTFGSVIKITGFPVDQAPPFRAREFYWSTARWHSHVIIGETVHGGVEYNLSVGGHGILGDIKEILGFDQTSPRERRKAQEVDERLDEIAQSVYTQAFNAYVAVSSTKSLDDLEDEVQAELERLAAIGFSPVLVTGESAQLLAYLSATTAIDLL